MPLPTFIGLGAQKCGTTALHVYLRAHPDACLPGRKELQFFRDSGNWHQGLGWYREQFSSAAPHQVCGEISPQYARLPSSSEVADRMAATVPDARLLYLVRDPIDRVVSAWLEARGRGRESRALEDSLVAGSPYVEHSRYHHQLQPFLAHYDRSRLLIVESSDLRHARRDTLTRIMTFVGLDPDRYQWDDAASEVHVSADKSRPSEAAMSVATSRVGRSLKRYVPTRLKRSAMRLGSRSLADDDTRLTPATRARLADELRPDVTALATLMPAGWHGWGLLD